MCPGECGSMVDSHGAPPSSCPVDWTRFPSVTQEKFQGPAGLSGALENLAWCLQG